MSFSAKYGHTNIVAADWRALIGFYRDVFGCIPVPPERDFHGAPIAAITGIPGAHIRGIHLRLPGHGDNGPTLEILNYTQLAERGHTAPNRPGFGHIAFIVDDLPAAHAAVLQAGGHAVGEMATLQLANGMKVTICYMTDPEGNIVELQSWSTQAAAPKGAHPTIRKNISMTDSQPPQPTTETNKTIVRRYIEEVINGGNLDLIDTLFVPEMRAAVRGFATVADESFPDRQEEILDIVAAGNTVMAHWVFRGTHRGLFYGIPATGKQIEINGFAVYYLENGQIRADAMCMDWLDAVEQLGGTIAVPNAG